MNQQGSHSLIDRRLCPRCCHLGNYLRLSRPSLQEVVLSVRYLQRIFLHAKSKAACEPHCLRLAATSNSLGKYDVIHKAGNTWRITTPPEEDRANHGHRYYTQKNLVNIGSVVPKIWFRADKRTDTDRQTDTRSSQYGRSNKLLTTKGPTTTTTTTTTTNTLNGPLSETTRARRYQKRKTNPDFTEARDSE